MKPNLSSIAGMQAFLEGDFIDFRDGYYSEGVTEPYSMQDTWVYTGCTVIVYYGSGYPDVFQVSINPAAYRRLQRMAGIR